jgi:hypothetical protein
MREQSVVFDLCVAGAQIIHIYHLSSVHSAGFSSHSTQES